MARLYEQNPEKLINILVLTADEDNKIIFQWIHADTITIML